MEALEPRRELDITLEINGGEHRLRVDARTTLLDALGDRLHLRDRLCPRPPISRSTAWP